MIHCIRRANIVFVVGGFHQSSEMMVDATPAATATKLRLLSDPNVCLYGLISRFLYASRTHLSASLRNIA